MHTKILVKNAVDANTIANTIDVKFANTIDVKFTSCCL